ncbi:CBO0543 family protein [Neobacillus sp. NPDC097160]|uniref:CBO0543 family protein n=1 Tax=Neobacillus sp. NPDC097160 TaxID=3364298 RepID=UPI003819F65F
MFDRIESLFRQSSKLKIDYWLAHDLFGVHWWFILIVNLISLIFLFIFIDRKRFQLILIAFLVSFTVISYLNELGHFYGFWSYPHQFLAFFQSFNAVDFAVLPVIITLIYQYFNKWSIYMVLTMVMSAIIGFIAVPIFVHFDLYKLQNWNSFYSFLTLVVSCCLVKILVDFIKMKSQQHA